MEWLSAWVEEAEEDEVFGDQLKGRFWNSVTFASSVLLASRQLDSKLRSFLLWYLSLRWV